MSGLFFNLGRSVGYAAIPAIRKSKSVWKSLTGDEAESVQAQQEFGRALAAELRLKVRLSQDVAERTQLQKIIDRLSARLRNKERTFRVEVLVDAEPSALALPGGFIFISTGLLDFCERNADELAFLLGHEIGHVVRGHALERVLKRIGTEGLSAVLSRGLLNPALREAGLKWLEQSHSREAELDADEFGMRVALAGGYDGQAALRLLDRIAARRKTLKVLGHYFSSHPAEPDRAAPLQALLK
ncbi:MAG: M48 family metallopeptidase [Verrucomicrobiota bacterium]